MCVCACICACVFSCVHVCEHVCSCVCKLRGQPWVSVLLHHPLSCDRVSYQCEILCAGTSPRDHGVSIFPAPRPQEQALTPRFLTRLLGMKLRASCLQGKPLATEHLSGSLKFSPSWYILLLCRVSLMLHPKPRILMTHEYTCVTQKTN
jgi:hypothetical protein